MSFSYSPSNFQINEMTPFTVTVTSIFDGNTSPTITSVSVGDTGVTTTHDSYTFTVSGQFTDQFTRKLDFLDSANKYQEVAKFNQMPPAFDSLYKYIAPVEPFKDVVVNIVYSDSSTDQYTIVVLNDWQTANAALVTDVRKGKF